MTERVWMCIFLLFFGKKTQMTASPKPTRHHLYIAWRVLLLVNEATFSSDWVLIMRNITCVAHWDIGFGSFDFVHQGCRGNHGGNVESRSEYQDLKLVPWPKQITDVIVCVWSLCESTRHTKTSLWIYCGSRIGMQKATIRIIIPVIFSARYHQDYLDECQGFWISTVSFVLWLTLPKARKDLNHLYLFIWLAEMAARNEWYHCKLLSCWNNQNEDLEKVACWFRFGLCVLSMQFRPKITFPSGDFCGLLMQFS